jgi:nucleotide exchange factor SIL1
MKSFRSNFVLILVAVLASKCETSKFVATNEWQDILEGQKVPAGLHYRMNLATGKKEAKLLVEENDESDTG